MTIDHSLRPILSKLDWDKAKDRDTGLADLKNFLSDDRNISQLDQDAWTNIFEYFGRCVEKQKALLLSKSSGTGKGSGPATKALKTLSQMSQDFRWICERADAGLKKALVKPVLQHVLSILPHRQGLFKPIALQYTKALRLLLSRRAYREHVPRDGWEALMKVCIDGLNDDEEEESMAELGNPARHPSTNTPRGSSRKALPAEMPELARIFALLVLGCPKNLAKYAKELLVFLARFFQAHPHETSCHMPLISATNHILFEISHEALPEIVEFFSSTIPYLIPLWETRSGSAVRVQLMYIFRFYLHIYDPSDGLLSSYWDLERNCMRLYDLLQRELGSKFGIGCVQSLEDFVKSIRGDWRKQTMLAVFKDEHSDLGESAISKQYLPFAFLDWCSNVYYSLLILEQKPSRGRTASDEIANRNGDFFSDSPRAGKKAKRIDVMTDLSQILSTKAGARGEKFCVLQILTILLIKHGERLPHDHIRGIEQIVSRVLAAGDTDLAGWALLCWTALPPKFITHGDASTLRVLVLDHAWKLMSANSVASPAGFYVLERMISQETASSEEILEVATQCGKVMRTGSSRPTACALHFILTFLQWSTVHGRQIANQSILQHQVLDWLLQDRFSDAQSTVPVDLVLRAVLVMIGVFSPEPIYSVEQSLALPVDMLEKEELICEWRLIRSRDLCKLVAHEDITTLDQFAIRNSCVTSGKPSSKFRQEPLLSKLLMTCANEVLSSWNTLEFAKKTLLKADSSGLPKLMDKSLFLCLLGITFGSVTCSHLPASSALQNEIEALFVLISRIIERICQSFPALPVIDQMSFIHSIARGFAVYCANRRENITVRTANATDSAMSELDAKLSTLCLPLVDTLIQHFSTTVEQINVTQTPLTASLAASVDEFDTLNLSTRNTGQNNPLGQLDFFYEVASPSEIPDRALTIRALGILYQLIPEGDESTIFSQARVRIQEVMMDALPSSFETFTQIGKEVTEFLRHASIKRLTTAFCKLVMKNSTTLLQSYEGELNTWCSIFIMESLTAILPVLLREKDDGDFMQEAGHVFAYFMRRVQSPSAPWRVCIAFGQLLIQYLIIDPNQSLFGESVGDDGADAAMRLCLALLNHDEFLVRLSMIGAIPQLFSIFDVADHTSIFEDIRDTIKKDAKSFLSLCTETLAFGEVMLNAAHERANAALQLLMVATRDDEAFHLVETAFDVYARRLALRDGLELLDELLPTLIWAWEEDLANFPYRLFAYESIDAFVSGHLDLNLPKLLSAGDIVAAEKLYLAIGAEGNNLFRRALPSMMAHLLPSIMDNVAQAPNDAEKNSTLHAQKAMKSFGFLKRIFGEDALNLMMSRCIPAIVAQLLKMNYDAGVSNLAHDRWNQIRGTLAQIDSLSAADLERSPNPQPPHKPFLDSEVLLRIILYLHGQSGDLPPSDVMRHLNHFFNTTTLRKLLQELHEHIDKLIFTEDKRRLVVNGYRLLIAITGVNISKEPFLFRTVLQQLLRTMSQPELCEYASGIFRHLFNVAMECNKTLVASSISSIAPALSQLVVTHTTAGKSKCARAVATALEMALEMAFTANPSSARLAILQLDTDVLGDRTQSIIEIAEKDGTTAHGDPNTILELMASGDPAAIAQLARVKYLRKALDTTDLAVQLAHSRDIANAIVGHLLAMLEGPTPAENLLLEVGNCLGRLAALLRSRILKEIPNGSLQLRTSTTKAVANITKIGHSQALRCLQKYLFHDDVQTVGVVIRTLGVVLPLPAGNLAFKTLAPDEADVLRMFTTTAKQVPRTIPTRTQYPSLEDDKIWEDLMQMSQTEDDAATKQHESQDLLLQLTNSLLQSHPTDEIFSNLGLVFEYIPAFAEVMLPHIVHAALEYEVKNSPKTIRKRSITTLRTQLSMRFRHILANASNLRPGILSTILKVIEVLRTQPHPLRTTPFDDNAWLDLDFDDLVQAATDNSSYASALLFLEIAQEETKREWGAKLGPSRKSDLNHQKGSIFKPLLQINQWIGDSDGFEGVMVCMGSETMLDGSTSLVQKYEHDNCWDKILNVRETQLKVGEAFLSSGSLPASSDIGTRIGLMKAMSNMGIHHILETYIRGSHDAIGQQMQTPTLQNEINEYQYECMWRNARWEDIPDRNNDGHSGQNQQLYRCLKAHHEKDATLRNSFLSSSLLDGVRSLCEMRLDNALNPFPSMRNLTMSTEIEELAAAGSNAQSLQKLFNIWELRLNNLVECQSFGDMEPVLAARTTTLQSLISRQDRSMQVPRNAPHVVQIAAQANCRHLLRYSQIGRKAGNLQIAQTAIARLNATLDVADPAVLSDLVDLKGLAKLESLKILWAQENRAVAARSLKRYLDLNSDLMVPDARASALSKGVESQLLCQLGRWVADTRFDHAATVLQKYFDPAVRAAAIANDSTLRAKAHYHLAKFADAQYEELTSNDPTDQIREHINYKQREADACEALAKQAAGRDPNASRRYGNMREKIVLQMKMDIAEEARYHADKDTFLEKSVENYLQALEYSKDHNDMSVFRLCALWFRNLENPRVNTLIDSYIKRISSSVFLVLMYQLSARLTTAPPAHEKGFQAVLQRLLTKVVRDHPHHTLYHIIALKNGTQVVVPSSRSSRQVQTTPTVEAALGLLDRLSRSDLLGDLVVRVEQLSNAYIELAFKKITVAMLKENKTLPLDARSKFAQIAQSGINVPIVTIEHPVRDDCRYDDLPCVCGFKRSFWVPGGVNMPRVVTCVGTNGKMYTQLVKGNDDLRQDAVLSKIFTIMNVLLRKNLETRKRDLAIRTYKVIPLAPRAGLVEWVNDTAPIGEYLTQAHGRYNPSDWQYSECRKRMTEQLNKGTPASKLALYLQIETNFRPVFRHFFFESFHDPVEWFERRLAYTRSVAVSSMAGYVVGLGDRHAQNILIDKVTAEVVHIDLGIAFDQGKLLAVPELVPFRLTRDIVDGMGITGVEGAFRRGCEETMRVLRNGSEVLLTILDVFRYDPLYNWKVTPLEQRRRQGLFDEDDAIELSEGAVDPITRDRGQNKEAERALFVVRKKLSLAVSVECQINELIQTAVDPRNFSRMFPGWQAWM